MVAIHLNLLHLIAVLCTTSSQWYLSYGMAANKRSAASTKNKQSSSGSNSKNNKASSFSSVSNNNNRRRTKLSKRNHNNNRGSSMNDGGNWKSDTIETWRLYNIDISPSDDDLHLYSQQISAVRGDTRDIYSKYLTPSVCRAICRSLKLDDYDSNNLMNKNNSSNNQNDNDVSNIKFPAPIVRASVVRRSLDARKRRRVADSDPSYKYVIDVEIDRSLGIRVGGLRAISGQMECIASIGTNTVDVHDSSQSSGNNIENERSKKTKPTVLIVGAGPAGLFCALELAKSGQVTPVLLERGQPVESRGRDIGSLVHRSLMNGESNFAFGEGGAGTWSDGKLTTRIGRNSDDVRNVLETFVRYGAPSKILVDGAPHLGTDNLVRLLRNMRQDIRNMGGKVLFGTKVTSLVFDDKSNSVVGVKVEYSGAQERNVSDNDTSNFAVRGAGNGILYGDGVVLATGHSARDVYEELYKQGVQLEAKGFATGFRVEHPQAIINSIQYGSDWGRNVLTGKNNTDTENIKYMNGLKAKDSDDTDYLLRQGHLPTASYRLATDKAFDGELNRGAYSFCMCPGGQIVPASTEPDEVCVNGMSFSKRDSYWANSALVVTVSPDDPILKPYREKHGILAGLAFQRDMERRASIMGGGKLVVPVQRLTDFIDSRPSISAPKSSYKLGVRPSACHEIYPEPIVAAMKDALVNHFDRQMKGFVCEEGLLHGVETRTSSPVRISRDVSTLKAIGTDCLYPAGEGAGFAGGIVSAAVDGLFVARAVINDVIGTDIEGSKEKRMAKSVGFEY